MWGALVWAYLMSASLLLHWSVEICGEVDKTSCPNLTYLPDLWLGTRYWETAILPIKDWLVALLRSEPVLFRVLILLGVAARLGELVLACYYLLQTFLWSLKTSLVVLSVGAVAVLLSIDRRLLTLG